MVERGQDGAPLRIVGTISDVTERKRGDEELRASEEKFRTLFESSRDAIMTSETFS